MTAKASRPCAGINTNGRRCKRRTANPDGWCGRCAGPLQTPPAAAAAMRGTLSAAGPDPLTGRPPLDVPTWEIPADPAERLKVARSKATDPAVLHALAVQTIHDADVADPAAPVWSNEVIVTLKALAANPATPAEHLTAWALATPNNSYSMAARYQALKNPSLPVPTMRAASAVYDGAIAQNPSCPDDLLGEIAVNQSWAWAAVRHPRCPPQALARVALSPGHASLAAVQNPACPPAVLEAVASLPPGEYGPISQNARLGAALSNPAFPPHRLIEFADHTDKRVRRGVAANPNTDPQILAVLAKDPNPLVRRAAARNPATPSASTAGIAANDGGWINRRAVAARPDAPSGILTVLAGDPKHQVRTAVAQNPNTDPQILGRLAADPRPSVRKAALKNKNTPAHGKSAAGLLSD